MDRKADAANAAAGAAKAAANTTKAGLLTKTPVLLGGVMVIEAVVLLAGFKLLGGSPTRASAAELVAEAEGHGSGKNAGDKNRKVEVPVVEFKAPNKSNGRTFLYDISIYVQTRADYEQRVKDAIKDKGALIQDRIRTIIAESDPEKLGGGSEPGLETLRRQVKYQLDEIVGDGVIDEVLVPRCIPFRTDY